MDRSSFYRACSKGNKDSAQKLLSLNSVKYVDPTIGDTPLHQACKQGWLDIVKLLIERYDCDPHVTTVVSCESLLHYACQRGHIDIVEYLVSEQCLNPLLKDCIQREPLDYALDFGHFDIAAYICRHCTSSAEILDISRIKTNVHLLSSTIDLSNLITADGYNIVQLVGSSESYISHMPSSVMLKLLASATKKVYFKFQPEWRTGDGDNLLELMCQSTTYLSQTSSLFISKCLEYVIVKQIKTSIPDSVMSSGETLAQLICHSEICTAHVSTKVLSKWLSDTTLDLEEIIISPEWKTADGDTILQIVCQFEVHLLQVHSALIVKWLGTTALDLPSLIVPIWKTLDGDTLFELVCQSSTCLSRIPSAVMLNRLTLRLSLDHKSSIVDHMKMVNPSLKTLDGDSVFHIVCQSEIGEVKLLKLIRHYIKVGSLDTDIVDSNKNTALHIACQADKPALVSFLLDESHCDPNIRNSMKKLPLDMTINPKVINYFCCHEKVEVYSETVEGWMNNIFISDTTMLKILQILVDNNKFNTKDGSTLLHITCATSMEMLQYKFRDQNKLIRYLITVYHSDPNCLDNRGRMPLQLTSDSTIMKELILHGAKMTADIVFKLAISKISNSNELFRLSRNRETMLWNPEDLNNTGYSALHLACKFGNPTMVNTLLSVAHCEPNIKSKSEEVPIELTSDLRIMKILVEHGAQMTADVIFKLISKNNTDSRVGELFKLSIRKGTMLWNHMNIKGYTALHLGCKTQNYTIVNFLISVVHCDPNIKSKSEEMPIELTSDLRIVKILLEHGAQMTANVVFKLISMHNTDSIVSELFKLSIRKGTMLWNPNHMNIDGYTILHLACKIDSFTIVNYLLSVAHCDPSIKSRSEEVPLQLTTNIEIIKGLIRHGAKTSMMYESNQNPLGTNEPIQPRVKVFIVGNPSVGKSTLTAALQKKIGIFARIFFW